MVILKLSSKIDDPTLKEDMKYPNIKATHHIDVTGFPLEKVYTSPPIETLSRLTG